MIYYSSLSCSYLSIKNNLNYLRLFVYFQLLLGSCKLLISRLTTQAAPTITLATSPTVSPTYSIDYSCLIQNSLVYNTRKYNNYFKSITDVQTYYYASSTIYNPISKVWVTSSTGSFLYTNIPSYDFNISQSYLTALAARGAARSGDWANGVRTQFRLTLLSFNSLQFVK